MRAIGLRASPKTVWFSVVEVNDDRLELLATQAIPVPEALEPPQQLRFIRQTVADTIEEYQAQRAGIRLAEPVARSVPIPRLHLEGVLQELLASSPVQAYFYGAIAKIGRLLGAHDRTDVKEYVGGRPFRGIAGWDKMKEEERESVLVAVASVGLEGA